MFIPATLWDVETLVLNLRPSDQIETHWMAQWAGRNMEHWSLAAELSIAFFAHDMFSLWDRGVFVGCAGIMPAGAAGVGVCWFLGTIEADARPVFLSRELRRFMASQERYFETIGNAIPPHMASRARWLHKIGFDILESRSMGESDPIMFRWRHSGPKNRIARPS